MGHLSSKVLGFRQESTPQGLPELVQWACSTSLIAARPAWQWTFQDPYNGNLGTWHGQWLCLLSLIMKIWPSWGKGEHQCDIEYPRYPRTIARPKCWFYIHLGDRFNLQVIRSAFSMVESLSTCPLIDYIPATKLFFIAWRDCWEENGVATVTTCYNTFKGKIMKCNIYSSPCGTVVYHTF